MRCAIDISIQDTPYLTGVEKTQRFILRELALIDRENQYFLISRRPTRLDFELPDNFRLINLEKQNPTYLWRERLLPPLLQKEKINVYYSPVSAIPVLGKAAKVATLHEIPWVERNRKVEPVRQRQRVWLFLNTRYAARIIAVSERTRSNILSLYPEAAERVQVIHHGVDERFLQPYAGPDRAEFLRAYGIPDRPYLLYVGTLRRKKNLTALLQAFAGLPDAVRRESQLILAGVRNVSYSDLDDRVGEFGLGNAVHFPGYVPEDDLPAFYHHAEALVYPSLFEGFGLPPLEAMASGTPVIASSGGAIPEVVGDAALLIDPTDVASFSHHMAELLTDADVCADLRQRGLDRVKKFTWRKTALSVLSLLESLATPRVEAAP